MTEYNAWGTPEQADARATQVDWSCVGDAILEAVAQMREHLRNIER